MYVFFLVYHFFQVLEIKVSENGISNLNKRAEPTFGFKQSELRRKI